MKSIPRALTLFAIGAFTLAAGIIVDSQSKATAEAQKLVMVGAWPPKVSAAADIGIKFLETVNQLSGGKLVIEFKGAKEVIPTFDQPEALVRGVFDIWYGAPNY